MKRKFVLLCALLMVLVLSAKNLTIQVKDITIQQVLPLIEQQTEYKFFYSSILVTELQRQVTLDIQDKDLKTTLSALFSETNIEYSFKDNIIALTIKDTDLGSGKRITGQVLDIHGEPIIGASVIVKHSSVGTITDQDGQFSLENVKEGAYISVSYIGYETYEQRIYSKTNSYQITLKESASALDEVVVVGYGTQKKVNLTGAVSVVEAQDLVGRPTQNMATALQGADPALNLQINSGGPSAGYNIDIRGVASINSSQGAQPLVLVDGVELDLARVNSNDVESVSILKDASAAAIYGAKAAAGVVLITTKSGKEGLAPTVSIDVKAGVKTPTINNDYITSGFWSAYINDLFMYNHCAYGYTTYTDADYAELWMRLDDKTENPERPWVIPQNDGQYKYYANFDWYHQLFKETRPIQDYNISLSGGNERVNYFVSGRAYLEDGMYRQNTDKFQQFSTRGKINVKIKKWLRYGLNLSFFSSNYTFPGTENVREAFRSGSVHSMAYVPATNPDGTSVYLNPWIYSGAGTVSDGVSALLLYGRHTNRVQNRELTMKHSLDIDLCKNLTLSGDYSFTWRTKGTYNRSVRVPYSSVQGQIAYIENYRSIDKYTQEQNVYLTHNYNIYLKWNPTWGDHHLTLMGGYNGENYRYQSLGISRSELITEELSSFNFAKGDDYSLAESLKQAVTNGVFVRANYDYAGRYLFELSVRADGSSRFAPGHRWGVFPAGSFGWRMSEEPFWESINNWWSNSKLRLSAGQLGNQLTGYHDYMQTIVTNGLFTERITLNGTSPLEYAYVTSPNASDLTWEKMTTYNVGWDLGFFRNRLTGAADFFVRNTTDMLIEGVALPSVYGAPSPKSNMADMRTIGWELSLGWHDTKRLAGHDFKYEFSFGIGNNKTVVTKFNNPTKTITSDCPYYEGMTLGEIWGYRIDGLFATDDAAASYPIDQNLVNQDIDIWEIDGKTGARAGDLMFKDLDGDGKITEGENSANNYGDKTIIGNSLPHYNYNIRAGFEYFGFDLSIFLQGVGKRDWYPDNEANTFWGPYCRPYQGYISKDFMKNVWNEDNPNAYFPRYRAYEALGTINSMGQPNDRYLQNIGYLRIKNITLGYTLPCWKKVFSEFRIYFCTENPYYWSPFKKHCKSIDPESAAGNAQGLTYEYSSTFTFGLTASF